jgi:hypothetical protein
MWLLARPNVLMFGDRTIGFVQALRRAWSNGREAAPVVIEVGAELDRLFATSPSGRGAYIRINVHEPAVRGNLGIGLRGRASELLRQIDERIEQSRLSTGSAVTPAGSEGRVRRESAG